MNSRNKNQVRCIPVQFALHNLTLFHTDYHSQLHSNLVQKYNSFGQGYNNKKITVKSILSMRCEMILNDKTDCKEKIENLCNRVLQMERNEITIA